MQIAHYLTPKLIGRLYKLSGNMVVHSDMP